MFTRGSTPMTSSLSKNPAASPARQARQREVPVAGRARLWWCRGADDSVENGWTSHDMGEILMGGFPMNLVSGNLLTYYFLAIWIGNRIINDGIFGVPPFQSRDFSEWVGSLLVLVGLVQWSHTSVLYINYIYILYTYSSSSYYYYT